MIREADNITVPIVQRRKLRHRAVKSYSGATVGKWQAWSLPESVVPGFEVGPRGTGGLCGTPSGKQGVTSNPSDLICSIGFLSRIKTFGIKGLSLQINSADRCQKRQETCPLSSEIRIQRFELEPRNQQTHRMILIFRQIWGMGKGPAFGFQFLPILNVAEVKP